MNEKQIRIILIISAEASVAKFFLGEKESTSGNFRSRGNSRRDCQTDGKPKNTIETSKQTE